MSDVVQTSVKFLTNLEALRSERDRLKASNKELLEALREIARLERHSGGDDRPEKLDSDFSRLWSAIAIARAAIARATKGE